MKLAQKILYSIALSAMLLATISNAVAGDLRMAAAWGCCCVWCIFSVWQGADRDRWIRYFREEREEVVAIKDTYDSVCEDLKNANQKLMSENQALYRKYCELEDEISADSADYGEWIDSSVPGSVLAECSLCHYDCGAYSMKFCPNCGKPMKGGAKDAENAAD